MACVVITAELLHALCRACAVLCGSDECAHATNARMQRLRTCNDCAHALCLGTCASTLLVVRAQRGTLDARVCVFATHASHALVTVAPGLLARTGHARARPHTVDFRRKNRSEQSLRENVARLSEYKANLIVFPKKCNRKKPQATDSSKDACSKAEQVIGDVMPIVKPKPTIVPYKITQVCCRCRAPYWA